MRNEKTVANVKITFLPMSQVSGLREDGEEKTCLCCGGYADGAILDGDKVLSACNSVCFYSGRADSAIEEIVVKKAEVVT